MEDQLLKQIKALENVSKLLEPEEDIRAIWNEKVLDYSEKFLVQLQDSKVYHGDNDAKGIQESGIGEESIELEDLLNLLHDHIDSSGINAASPGHMGYIPGGGIYPSALGDFLAAVTNRYAGIYFAAPGAVRLENLLIRWMIDLMGFPASAVGNLTSGGSISNLIAVVTARESRQLKAKDFHKAVIYLSSEAHHSNQKALRISGLGEAITRYIPLDDQLKMDVDALKGSIQEDTSQGLIPLMIIASLGTTGTGVVDPIEEMAWVAKRFNIWFHVDAAYGGFFKLVESIKPLFRGVEKADSITLDPHKSLFLPFGTGAVLIKDAKAVFKAHYYTAGYMQDANTGESIYSPADLSPELTKHFRGLRLWLPLKLFGLKPFRAALEEKMYLARYFYREVKKMDGIETGPFPELSIVLFRFCPLDCNLNELNQQLIKEIQQDGRIFLTSTTINGDFWIRVAILLFRGHLKHVDLLLDILRFKIKQLHSH